MITQVMIKLIPFTICLIFFMFIFALFQLIMGADASNIDEDYQGVSKFNRLLI